MKDKIYYSRRFFHYLMIIPAKIKSTIHALLSSLYHVGTAALFGVAVFTSNCSVFVGISNSADGWP